MSIDYYGFTIDGDGDTSYEDDVKKVLDQMVTNWAALSLWKAIWATGNTLTITPYTAADSAASGTCNAFPEARNDGDARPKIKYYLGNFDDPSTPADERFNQSPTMGTGKGTDVKMHFSPDTWKHAPCAGTYIGTKPDEVLLHEMVHALREMQGLFNPWPTTGTIAGYKDEEEFLAVVIANVYLSAKGNPDLRGDYMTAGKKLTPPNDTSAGFLADPAVAKILAIYNLFERMLFLNLSLTSKAAFNPFRELLANPKKYGT
jgi:hypothetical protein